MFVCSLPRWGAETPLCWRENYPANESRNDEIFWLLLDINVGRLKLYLDFKKKKRKIYNDWYAGVP